MGSQYVEEVVTRRGPSPGVVGTYVSVVTLLAWAPCLGTCRLELVPHVSYIHVFLSFTPRFGGRTNGVLIVMLCRALTLSNDLSGLRFVFKFKVVGLKLTTI